ncbi:MAG: S8 family peptidase [Candidatus Marinimicrobia bacterium]|nr:S8 family peptidase [Candidatus Neomarinimicrobiota bacterium]
MPEKPLLILPTPGRPIKKQRKYGGPGNYHFPSRSRQTERLGPKFKLLEKSFETRRVRLKAEATGITPEDVIVLETAVPIEEFINTIRYTEGMEWVGEIEREDIPPDDDFYAMDSKDHPKLDKLLRGRAYLIFSNHQALNELLSYWKMWQENKSFPRGLGRWNALFTNLIDLRPWGVQDRLRETGILQDWKERIEHESEILPTEIELWYHKNLSARETARERVIDLILSEGGQIVSESIIEEIAYHGILAHLPASNFSSLVDGVGQETNLIQCEQIQYFRATGQMSAGIPIGDVSVDESDIDEVDAIIEEPIIALLDGLPLQNHRRLEHYLKIDDPDNIEPGYQAHERVHGTAMASLILYGDLGDQNETLTRKLYVRPILQPDSRDWRSSKREESVPNGILVTDLIFRSVRRMFEHDGADPPSAPTVCIINFSIGIKDRLFDGALSPLARLLDWLAWRYKVLFIVSAGNHAQEIEIDIPKDDFSSKTPAEIQDSFIRAIAADTRNRRLLSPAEAINVLTVGSIHDDSSGISPIYRSIDPYIDDQMPSPINAQGMGHRRAIKPEILASGGKIVLTESLKTNSKATFDIYSGTLQPGHKVATPGTTPGVVTSTIYTRGTSNAAALTSRSAAILYDLLEELRNESGGDIIDTIPRAVWLKALLAHAADWDLAGDVLTRILKTPENSRQFKEYITRILGYGSIEIGKVIECTEHRVTGLSCGNLSRDQSYIHKFPLPPSLSGIRGWRRLTLTLAWLSPVNPLHQKWRRADLWFSPTKEILNVDRKQADWQAVRRGTLQHEILEGNRAATYVDGDNIEIQVNCRADAGELADSIPYSLVASLEVKDDIGITIYDEIRTRVQALRVQVTTSTA